ncbi:MAG TPA: hypothetical protein VK892_17565, partial [Pyrinomonadaceae bacterium]|nr:hypothetical protein [Pyrinomonadaceae bacterium]
SLVEQQVSESKTVEETDKRIRILIRSADFLWKFDEQTARAYFTEAFKVSNERFLEKGFEEKKAGEKERLIRSQLPDHRLEVIRAIAKRDSEWAKNLSEQILKEYEKSVQDRTNSFNETRELNDLLNLAKENVKTKPGLSWHLFRRLMNYRLYFHWYCVLFSFSEDNQEFADALYAELLQNYRTETPRRLLFLSAYPFAGQRIFGIDKYQFGASVPKNLIPKPNLQRQFFETFFQRARIFANNPDDINRAPDQHRQPEALYIFSALQEFEPIIIQNFPNLLQRFSEARALANSLMNEENRKKLGEREKIFENIDAGFDKRLEITKKAESDGKLTDYMILGLVTSAKKEEEYKQIESWLNKIQEEETRKDTANYFYFLRSKLAIKEGRFDDARKYALKIPEIEHRAVLFFDIAGEQLKNVNETTMVLDTLNEVSKIARQADNTVEKAQVLFGLAVMYEKVNHTMALDELAEAIRIVNQLENPNIFSSSVIRQITGKDFGFFASYSTPGFNMETTFQEISKKDFELSLAHAKSFNDKYFRTLAVLAVAKNCVENASKKKAKG